MASRYIPGSFFQAGSYGKLGGATQRNFTTLDPTFSMYGTLDADIELASGDLVRINATTSTTAQDMFITDGDTLGASIELKADGSIEFATSAFNSSFTVDGVSKTAGVAAAVPFDGKQHTLVFTSITATQIINFIASDNAVTTTFKGILSNFEHERSSVILRNYEIKEDWSANLILVDTGTDGINGTAVNIDSDDAELFTLGTGAGQAGWIANNQLVINPTFDTDTVWVKTNATISGGVASLDSDLGISRVRQNTASIIGRLLVGYEVVSSNTNGLELQVREYGGSGSTPVDAEVGSHELIKIFEAQGISMQANMFTGSIDNVSAKRFLEIA